MKYGFTLLYFILITSFSYSQTTIKLEDASKHVGDSIRVCGKVFSSRFMESAKGSPTLINLGAAYPNQLLTVVIWNDVRKQFETAPEVMFKDKEICVTGKIELYKDKPELVVKEKEEVVVE